MSLSALAAGLVLSGCAVEADAPEASPTPDDHLAATADVAAENEGTASEVGKGRGSAGRTTSTQAGKSDADEKRAGAGANNSSAGPTRDTDGGDSASRQAGGTGSAVDWDELSAAADDTGDHGNGPAYADITALTIRDSGKDALLRVTVADVLPGKLVTGEVQGVGVDLYRSSDQESDYQVFFDGGTHGWRAFLQTPDGFVEFPGTFAVAGRTLTATVPWASLGGREDASVSAFADWSSGVGRLSADGVTKTAISPG